MHIENQPEERSEMGLLAFLRERRRRKEDRRLLLCRCRGRLSVTIVGEEGINGKIIRGVGQTILELITIVLIQYSDRGSFRATVDSFKNVELTLNGDIAEVVAELASN
jgi:hypothetical protein